MAKLAVIGDEMTATGMRLAGLEHSYTATEDNAQEIYDRVKEEVDILAITHRIFESIKNMDEHKITVRIPDASGGGGDMVKDLVKSVVGFEVRTDG
jgi:vacuolar-type H+-ATPase subunit F/Vma7